jgi:hypothetical protein
MAGTQIKMTDSQQIDFNLEEVAFDILTAAKPAIAKKQLDIYYHYSAKTPRFFQGDVKTLQQIIQALLAQSIAENASEKNGDDSITLSIYHDVHDPQSIIIAAANTHSDKTVDGVEPSYQAAVKKLRGKLGSQVRDLGTVRWVSLKFSLAEKHDSLTINSLGGHSIAVIHDNEETLKYVSEYLEQWGAKNYCSKVNGYNHIPMNKIDLLIITPSDYLTLKHKPHDIPIVLLENRQDVATAQLKLADSLSIEWPNLSDQLLKTILDTFGILLDPSKNNKKSIFKDHKDQV